MIVMLPNLTLLFYCLSEAAKKKRARKGFRLVWPTVVWSMERGNDVIFNGIIKRPLDIVED